MNVRYIFKKFSLRPTVITQYVLFHKALHFARVGVSDPTEAL